MCIRDRFTRHLAELGYEKNYQVQTSGEFSVRGGIIDIFPVSYTHLDVYKRQMLICPAKCDFFYVSDAGVIVAHTALNQVYDQLGGKSEHIIKIEERIDCLLYTSRAGICLGVRRGDGGTD